MNFICKTLLCTFAFSSFNITANQFDYLGVTFQNNDYDDLNFSPLIDTASLTPLKFDSDSSSTGYRIFIGHHFNNYIAIEAGMATFGKASFSVVEESIASNGKSKTEVIHNGDFKTLTGDIRVIITYPLTETFFFKGYLGGLLWNNEFSFLSNKNEIIETEKVSDTGISLIKGVGLGYGFNDNVAVSLDIESTRVANITVNNLAFSLLFQF